MQFCTTNTNHLRREKTTQQNAARHAMTLKKFCASICFADFLCVFYIVFVFFWLFYLTLCLVCSLLGDSNDVYLMLSLTAISFFFRHVCNGLRQFRVNFGLFLLGYFQDIHRLID